MKRAGSKINSRTSSGVSPTINGDFAGAGTRPARPAPDASIGHRVAAGTDLRRDPAAGSCATEGDIAHHSVLVAAGSHATADRCSPSHPPQSLRSRRASRSGQQPTWYEHSCS